MKVNEWADFVKDNRIGPLLRELGDALEECGDPVLIAKATKMMVHMGQSAQTMLYYRDKAESARKSSGELGADNGG
tara:strand:- start:259 stop:486 length:228 start_codon:yes stop_codon:yes gene_type:complete